MARYRILKEYVKTILNEGYNDIVEVVTRVRVKITANTDPNLLDVLTDIRGIKNVITVKQLGELSRADINGRQFATLMIKFEDDETYGVADLERDANLVKGIDIVKIVTYEGKPYVRAQQIKSQVPVGPPGVPTGE